MRPPSAANLRRAAVAAALVLPLAGLFAAFAGYDVWKDSHWHPSGVGGVTAMAFSPANQRILLTATSVPMDGVNDLWDGPTRPGPGCCAPWPPRWLPWASKATPRAPITPATSRSPRTGGC